MSFRAEPLFPTSAPPSRAVGAPRPSFHSRPTFHPLATKGQVPQGILPQTDPKPTGASRLRKFISKHFIGRAPVATNLNVTF